MFLSSFGVGGERVGKAEARFSRRRWQFGDGKGGWCQKGDGNHPNSYTSCTAQGSGGGGGNVCSDCAISLPPPSPSNASIAKSFHGCIVSCLLSIWSPNPKGSEGKWAKPTAPLYKALEELLYF